MSARQLALDLPVAPSFAADDFVLGPTNTAAFRLVEAWPNWPDRVLVLVGPAGSGKTHLASIWADRARAQRLRFLEPAAERQAPRLEGVGAVLIEDADRAACDEAELFHLINRARVESIFLALTARSAPDAWGLGTRDLLSRLRQAPLARLGEPDDELMRAVLTKLFVDRQIDVDESVVAYLALRLERSFEAARKLVQALDRAALEGGRRITRALAAEVFARATHAQDGEA